MNIRSLLAILMLVSVTSIHSQNILTKEQAITFALENNFGIKIAKNNVTIAANDKGVLNTGYLPTVTGTAGATFNRDNTEAEFLNGDVTTLNGATSSRYNARVNVNYTLFDGLGRLYDYKRLKETHQLTELQARQTIENTIFQLFTVYYNVAQLSENVNALEETITITKDRLKRAEYQFEYGQSTKLAVLNAQVDINNDSINLINQRQAYKNTKRDLNVVIGNVLDENTFDVNAEVNFLLQLNKADLLTKMKANNVSLLQVNKNISISNYTLKSGTSAFLPTIGLTGSYGWNKNNNNAASFLTTSTNTGISGGLNLTWNLFDGRAVNIYKNAKIALQNQEYEKQSLIQSIERDFNNAWDDYQNKLTVYRVQEDNIVTSKNNFDRTAERFKLGQATSIEFRQAQLNLLNAELSKIQAKFQAKIAELLVLQISGELLNVDF
ncbi:TolC family protein [Winogradskyella immobilis]|uniref:TolC family protein n=1 Tax=Winogradskyella immobilis TaxID=2816852 RepID=A0ABS8ENY1_9FLAO|nr:TolC family protein [Winogradskyella immobilis]MCC1484017.1 TolC family protein [Winogradskyella immobilis]MCG0016109.1 TolC family protein [Winogradskyella immobilis]